MELKIFTFVGLISQNHDWIYLASLWVVIAIALFVAFRGTSSLQLVPNAFQNAMEMFVSGVVFVGKDVIGEEKARKYIPLTATIFILVLISNLIGIIPGFEPPSANINMTLSLALIVFFYYHFEGIRINGIVKYLKHFWGEYFWLGFLMFPLEIISHISRIISLSFRLFGNVKGDDMLLLVLLYLTPWLIPVSAFFVMLIFGMLQAYIFTILTYVYLAGATTIDESH